VLKHLKSPPDSHVYIWQDKKLSPSQISLLPAAQVQNYPLDNVIFKCLYAIKPNNHKALFSLLAQVFSLAPIDLFLYLLKKHLRKSLTGYSGFNQQKLKRAYLQLVELDYLNKSGLLPLSKETGIQRILLNLLS